MKTDTLIADLDTLLSSQESARQEEEDVGGNEAPRSSGGALILQPDNWPEIKVKGTSITIVAVVLDDSISIKDKEIGPKLIEGVQDMIEELKSIARKQREIFLNITGFRRTYFCGNVLDADPDEILDNVSFSYGSTPLAGTAAQLVRTTKEAETALNDQGISVAVSMLLVTDGHPECDTIPPDQFNREYLQENLNWNFSGMGITRENEYSAQSDREEFTQIFQKMGIDKIVTPSSNGVKAALYQFSKSVSAV